MKDEKKLDAILERFYNSYNKYNTKVLEELGNVIKQFDGLNPSQAHKLGQELKYSNSTKFTTSSNSFYIDYLVIGIITS